MFDGNPGEIADFGSSYRESTVPLLMSIFSAMESRRLRIGGKAVLGFLLFGWQFAPFTLHSQRNLSRISVSWEQVWNITVGQESNWIRKSAAETLLTEIATRTWRRQWDETVRFCVLLGAWACSIRLCHIRAANLRSQSFKFQKSVCRFKLRKSTCVLASKANLAGCAHL